MLSKFLADSSTARDNQSSLIDKRPGRTINTNRYMKRTSTANKLSCSRFDMVRSNTQIDTYRIKDPNVNLKKKRDINKEINQFIQKIDKYHEIDWAQAKKKIDKMKKKGILQSISYPLPTARPKTSTGRKIINRSKSINCLTGRTCYTLEKFSKSNSKPLQKLYDDNQILLNSYRENLHNSHSKNNS
jgi:hypothetical protein